jgi:hypothetical protein
MRPIRIVLFIASLPFIFMGLMFMIASVFIAIRMITGFFMLLIAIALIGAGIYLVKEPIPLEEYESRVADLARENKGKLTIGQVSADLRIPSKKARDVLNQLARRGACQADFEPTELGGTEIFIFPEFAPKTKRQAR